MNLDDLALEHLRRIRERRGRVEQIPTERGGDAPQFQISDALMRAILALDNKVERLEESLARSREQTANG